MLHGRGKSHRVQHLVGMVCWCDVTEWRQRATNDPVINSDGGWRAAQSNIIHLENMMDFMTAQLLWDSLQPSRYCLQKCRDAGYWLERGFVNNNNKDNKKKEAELKAVFLQPAHQSPMRETEILFQDCSNILIRLQPIGCNTERMKRQPQGTSHTLLLD